MKKKEGQSVSASVSEGVSVLEVLALIEGRGKETIRIKSLQKNFSNASEENIHEVVEKLLALGVLSRIGTAGLTFGVNADEIEAAKSSLSRKRLKKFEAAPKSKSLADLMQEVSNLTSTSEGEITARKAELAAKFVDLVGKTNELIAQLAESYSAIDPATAMVEIIHDDAKVEANFYRYNGKKKKGLFAYTWPKPRDLVGARWSEWALKDAESHCSWLISEMIKFVSE